MASIEVRNVVKEFRIRRKGKGLRGAVRGLFTSEVERLRAVDDVSFSIDTGEIVAYIGPNGAGKSTTIKMMSGILTPTEGEIRINGISPQADRKKVVRNLGVVFGQRTQLNWDLRLGESFELLKYIYQIPAELYKENLKRMDEILGINQIIDTPVRQLSLGQRMRGDLAAAMLHSPSVLFLDEPTIGLDVDGKSSIRKFIKEINRTLRTTIILTTHDLGDIQELCHRLIILNKGKIIGDGSLEELIDRVAPYRQLIVDFYEPERIEHPNAAIVSSEELRTVYRFEKGAITAARLIDDISKQAKIKDLRLEEAKIEDVISYAYHEQDSL